MKMITIEEHIPGAPLSGAVQKYAAVDAPYSTIAAGQDLPYFPNRELFVDIGEKRLADMDAAGITMQILSSAAQAQLLPVDEAAPIVEATNDALADGIARNRDRFAGFAALPWSNPQAAARELERAATKLGFKGAILSGRASSGKEFLDDEQFIPVLEAAEALEMPIYIHPAPPMLQVQQAYYAGLGNDQLSARLSLYGWGWHNEAGIQVLRMILRGTLERFPKLQLIAGHWGEMVPFFLSRLDQALPRRVTKLQKSIIETFKQNVYVTPSGIFDYPQLQFAIQVLGADRIIHSVDFPFIANEGARAFIENAPISHEDKEKISHVNAEELFRL